MHRRYEQGWIEVIAGPMFSGKSEELIRRVTRYGIARIPVQTFKPQIDTRYATGDVVSHSNLSTEAIPVGDSSELLHAVEDRSAQGPGGEICRRDRTLETAQCDLDGALAA